MRLICALWIVFALGPTPASADEPYEPKVIPPCRLYKTAQGIEVCGYVDLEDYKQVLRVDAELVHLRERLKIEQARTAELLELKGLCLTEVQAIAGSQAILRQHADRLQTQLIDLDKRYQDERVKLRWGSPIAWTIAAVSTAVLVGFVASSALN